MFRIPAFLIKPIIYVLMAAAAAFVLHKLWAGFKDRIAAPYVAAQIAKDQPLIDKANANAAAADAERDHAKEDTAACVASSKTQSDAIAAANTRATNAQNATKAILEAAKRDAAEKQGRIKALQATAMAPRVDMTCPDELAKARAIIQDTLRARRAAPVTPPTPRDALGLPAAK